MYQEIDFDPAYQQFIQTLVRQREVFTLLDAEEYYAECPSEVYDDNLGEPVAVYCFWETAQAAQICQNEEWSSYHLAVLDLEEFMSEVLLEMDEDEHLVGVAFDEQLFGTEVEPMELLADLLTEIEAQNQQDTFETYDKLLQYCQSWQEQVSKQHIIH
ncbi:DUF2750 domain-containing protein [Neisseriaceae bacterium B1]